LQWATKKVESMGVSQSRRFYRKMKCLPLWPNYIGEKGRTLGKTYGIKAKCYWEHIGNLGNILKTWWEHIENLGNILETWWEPIGNKGKMKKKSRQFECMPSLPRAPSNYFQKISSPFLAWANTLIINWVLDKIHIMSNILLVCDSCRGHII
jgi:hypothetical protein